MRYGLGKGLAAVFGFVLLLAPCLLVPGPAGAEIEIKPLIELEGLYTTNYFQAETNEAEVFILKIAPGIKIDVINPSTRLLFHYQVPIYFHFDVGDSVEDIDDENYVGHDARLAAYKLFGERTTIGITDNFFLTREAAEADEFGVPGIREKYFRNQVRPYLIYDIEERGEIQLAYRHENIHYVEGNSPDSQEARGFLTLTYNFSPTRHLDLDIQVWYRWFERFFSDYTSYQARLIYRHEFNEFFRGEAGFGWQFRDFEDDSLDDPDEPTGHIGFTAEGGQTKANLMFERNFNDFNQFGRYYVAYRIKGYVERWFLEDLKAHLGGAYQFGNYVNDDREDDFWNFNASLGYAFLNKMMTVSLGYNFNRQDSNEVGQTYDEHQVFLNLMFIYDFEEE